MTITKLKELLNTIEDFSFFDIQDNYRIGSTITVKNHIIEFVGGSIYNHGGEGSGERADVVIKIDNKYFEIPCSYSSYDESTVDIDYLFEVEPYKVIETRYVEKGKSIPKNVQLTPDSSYEEDSYNVRIVIMIKKLLSWFLLVPSILFTLCGGIYLTHGFLLLLIIFSLLTAWVFNILFGDD